MTQDHSLPLKGRVAVITGSSRNIGREIALALSRDGAAVAINARSNREEAEAVAEEVRRAGGQAIVCLADVTDEAQVGTMMRQTAEAFGGIDILVNNAAIRREAPLESTSYADWRDVLSIILDGAFLCTMAALGHLKERRGTIINIGGMSAHTGARSRVHVVTAKTGLVGLTRALATDLAPYDITVNLVAPGMIETRRQTSSSPSEPEHHKVHKPLLGRRGTPADVAGMVRMLCGPEGRYVTGQTIHVNGGGYLP